MKMLRIAGVILIILVVIFPARAQERWSLEIRGGAHMATQDLGDADLGLGIGFEGTAAYRFMPHLAVYGGWGWNHFNSEESFAGSDIDFEETGYTFGFQFIHPVGQTDIHYMLRAGGVFNHIEAENQEGDALGDTEHELGWQIGAGLMIPLNGNWRLLPSVRYRSLSTDFENNGTGTPVDLKYVSLGIGLSRSF